MLACCQLLLAPKVFVSFPCLLLFLVAAGAEVVGVGPFGVRALPAGGGKVTIKLDDSAVVFYV